MISFVLTLYGVFLFLLILTRVYNWNLLSLAAIVMADFNVFSVLLALVLNAILCYIFSKKCSMRTMQKVSMIYAYVFMLVVSNVILNASKLSLIFIVATIVYWFSDIVLFVQKFISKNTKVLLDVINKIMYYSAQILFVMYIYK